MSATAVAPPPLLAHPADADLEEIAPSEGIVPIGTWTIAEGSHLGFTVRSLALPVRGSFGSFHGQIVHRAGEGAMVSGSVDVASLDTGVGARDAHLRSSDFFDAAAYPEITFASRRIIGHDGHYDIPGALTIKGVMRDVSLTGRVLPPEPGDGDQTVRIAADGVIDRTAFGVKAPARVEGFGLTVARRVKLHLLIVAVAAGHAGAAG
jgi:polyisoprenoid-binding protein YceI